MTREKQVDIGDLVAVQFPGTVVKASEQFLLPVLELNVRFVYISNKKY